jgi:glutaredoxin
MDPGLSMRRYAHIEADCETDTEPVSLLWSRVPRYRWGCDYCRRDKRCSHGRWTSLDKATIDAEEHDQNHADESAMAVKHPILDNP